jgi:hypothetical protein
LTSSFHSSALVYIAAFAPDADETTQSLQEKFPATDIFSHIEVADGHVWLKANGVPSFAGDLPEHAQKLVWATHATPTADLFNQKVPHAVSTRVCAGRYSKSCDSCHGEGGKLGGGTRTKRERSLLHDARDQKKTTTVYRKSRPLRTSYAIPLNGNQYAKATRGVPPRSSAVIATISDPPRIDLGT